MKQIHVMAILLMAGILMAAMSAMAFADTFKFDGKCTYNGDEITSDFTTEDWAASQADMEPGDDLHYSVKYTNKSGHTTSWYMRNSVLETLEEAKDAAENGGYTYKLINVGPSGKKTVLFDNSEVGGETKVDDLEGLKQATNATGDYFFIQKLKSGETATTELYVALDGETEVNDYMDTRGALMVSYAVEEESGDKTRTVVQKTPRTGDPMDLMKYILMMVLALVVAFLAILSWRRDKKKAAAEGAGGAEVVMSAAETEAKAGGSRVTAAETDSRKDGEA